MIIIIIVILFLWNTFIPSRNLYEVFTYNHIAQIFIRNRFHVKASMVFTRAYHVFIHNYIRSLLNIILRPILIVRVGPDNPRPIANLSDALANEIHRHF